MVLTATFHVPGFPQSLLSQQFAEHLVLAYTALDVWNGLLFL